MRALLALILAALPLAAAADDMTAVAGYDQTRLVGDWYEVAGTPSMLEHDCHGTTVNVALRVDKRLVMKMTCHKGSVTGKALPIDGVLVATDLGIFEVHFVHLMELGGLVLVVLWQADDNSMAVLGSPTGDVGWVWSKVPHPDAAALQTAEQQLVKAGYVAAAISPVDQGN
jgi:apolipoprotein D and lipocalin family protein